MNAGELIGRDVFLRYDAGPVQAFRAWDVARFVQSQMDQGRDAKPPIRITIATAEEYRAEHRREPAA